MRFFTSFWSETVCWDFHPLGSPSVNTFSAASLDFKLIYTHTKKENHPVYDVQCPLEASHCCVKQHKWASPTPFPSEERPILAVFDEPDRSASLSRESGPSLASPFSFSESDSCLLSVAISV